jgi:hypothetical protein
MDIGGAFMLIGIFFVVIAVILFFLNKSFLDEGAMTVVLWAFGITCAICFIIFNITGVQYTTVQNGKHVGQITAIEDSGIIWKTTTVYVKSDISSSQEDKYCLIDKSLLQKLNLFARNSTKVSLYYDSWLINGWQNCGDEAAIITEVNSIADENAGRHIEDGVTA